MIIGTIIGMIIRMITECELKNQTSKLNLKTGPQNRTSKPNLKTELQKLNLKTEPQNRTSKPNLKTEPQKPNL